MKVPFQLIIELYLQLTTLSATRTKGRSTHLLVSTTLQSVDMGRFTFLVEQETSNSFLQRYNQWTWVGLLSL